MIEKPIEYVRSLPGHGSVKFRLMRGWGLLIRPRALFRPAGAFSHSRMHEREKAVYGLTWPNGYDIDAIRLHNDMKDAGKLPIAAA